MVVSHFCSHACSFNVSILLHFVPRGCTKLMGGGCFIYIFFAPLIAQDLNWTVEMASRVASCIRDFHNLDPNMRGREVFELPRDIWMFLP